MIFFLLVLKMSTFIAFFYIFTVQTKIDAVVKEKVNPRTKQDNETKKLSKLILFNDDVNSFDHVIDSLIEVCEHSQEQAEQCTLITHLKGKCAVKSGTKEDLLPRMKSLHDRMLNSIISS